MTKKATPIFDIELRHGGDLLHSIPMHGVTSREMRILRRIHGEDAVANMKEASTREVDETEELYEFCVKYSKSLDPRAGRALVERVFNVELDGNFEKWLIERDELAQLEAQERMEKSQRDAALFTRAREAAEAQVRAAIAMQAVGVAMPAVPAPPAEQPAA